MLAHDWLNGFRRFICVIERNRRDIVVQDVCLDDAVEQSSANEAELTIDGGSGAARKVPRVALVMREGRIGVLKISDANCSSLSADSHIHETILSLPSQ